MSTASARALVVSALLGFASLASTEPIINTVYALDNHNFGEVSYALGLDGNPRISFLDLASGALMLATCQDPTCAGGNTIISMVANPGNALRSGYKNSLLISPEGHPVIAYFETDASGIIARLMLTLCNDHACQGGDEASSLVAPASTLQATSGSLDLMLGEDGLPLLVYSHESSHSLRVAKCNDAGCAGGDEQIAQVYATPGQAFMRPPRETQVAKGESGLPEISFKDCPQGPCLVYLIRCNDPACSGDDEVPLVVLGPGPTDARNHAFALAPNAERRVFVVLGLHTAENPDPDLTIVACSEPTCAQPIVNPIVEPLLRNCAEVDMSLIDGLPSLLLRCTAPSLLRLITCADLGCLSREYSVLDAPVLVSSRGFSFGGTESGTPQAAYYDAFSRTIRFASCLLADCVDGPVDAVFADGFDDQ